jgi:hypothetical protein
MNAVLNKLAIEAGAPTEVMDQLWFQVFCLKFADLLIKECEESNA